MSKYQQSAVARASGLLIVAATACLVTHAEGAGLLGILKGRPSKPPVQSWPMPAQPAGSPKPRAAAPRPPVAPEERPEDAETSTDTNTDTPPVGAPEGATDVGSDQTSATPREEREPLELAAVPDAPEPPADVTLEDSPRETAARPRETKSGIGQAPRQDRPARDTRIEAASETVRPTPAVLVPGTGTAVKGGGDDFEDETWKWNYRHPKSSEEQDDRVRGPIGTSVNKKWFEGMKRGTPDLVKRIELPSPGLAGSTHGLLLATLHAGIPGRVTYTSQQDDFVFDSGRAVGSAGMSVLDSPSIVTRVYLPPFEQWERRAGASFGFRAGCFTHAIITGEDHPDRGEFGVEEYWPGMFICFEPGKGDVADGAYIRIRGGRNGREIRGPAIDQLGWWTLGMSFSPDGQVHYFAGPGVDDLTMEDHMTSQFPYGYRTERVKTFFYNVCTRDDGQTWSTPWVIDDPQLYFVKQPQMAKQPQRPTRTATRGTRSR
jgi:hypothetical protein